MGRHLGQHFLKTGWPARALAHAAGIKEGDAVLEIGPGKGALTRELLKTGANIIAVEKDERLAQTLEIKFAKEIESGSLTIERSDIRDIEPEKMGLKGRYILAANIPYYITGEILRQFLTSRNQPDVMALLVQKEVAERIVSGTESILSISVKAYGFPRIVKKVARGNFSPPPAVDSAILAIEGISKKFFRGVGEEHFFRIVRAGFASKRKFLSNNLAAAFGKEKALSAIGACGIPEKSRAENVPLEKWKCLAQELANTTSQ